VKRLLGLVVGGLGLGALLRRRRSAPVDSPADDLRERLAAARTAEPPAAPVPPPAEAEPAAAPPVEAVAPAADEAPEVSEPADRRAEVHQRARRAIDELRER